MQIIPIMEKGLISAQVVQRMTAYGKNELPSSKPKSIVRIAFEILKEPMFLLLISCASLYILLGDYREGIILLASIVIIIAITFYQHNRTEKALDALKSLSSPRVLVLREGEEKMVAGSELVPDDIMIVREGDRISADGLIIKNINLSVNEAVLTGESISATKHISTSIEDENGWVFRGSLVVKGNAVVRVIHTGISTRVGTIGASLSGIKEEETRMQKEMNLLIRNLFIIGVLISVLVFLAFYITRGNIIQSLLRGLSSAMAILPEEFPVVLTIFLALGAWRLSKINVLTRKPTAIETLGAATVLCSDKTGTITQNKMEVNTIFTEGQIYEKNEFVGNIIKLKPIIEAAYLASSSSSADPMDHAFQQCYKSHFTNDQQPYTLLKEYVIQKDLLTFSRVLKYSDKSNPIIYTKGAPESIFQLCQLDDFNIATHMNRVNEMAKNGSRVIAVAGGELAISTVPESQGELPITFYGLIGMEDPIREEVPKAIAECQSAGIKVIMITGDFPATARSIASKIGLPDNQKTMTGSELEVLSELELSNHIKDINVFARVVPEQKLRIVNALKANREIVCMTGDGINDAPALKAAHVGIAMGNKGTDVAREASALVLLDDNFASIVAAIRSGRKIFDNLQKAMSYIIAIHIPIIALSLLPAFLPSMPLLLLPVHIVFLELIIDPVCSVAFENEQEEEGIMQRPPRQPEHKFFGFDKLLKSSLQGILLLVMVLSVYFISQYETHTEGEIRSITFCSLIMGNVFLIVSKLSKTKSAMVVFKEKNYTLIFILISAIVLLFLILSLPFLQKIFSFEFPGYQHFLVSIFASFIMLLILEGIKYHYKRKRNYS